MFHVKHFLSLLTDEQHGQLREFERLFVHINASVNLVSRPSEAGFWNQHILQCLAWAQRGFPQGAVVVDWGTGGGLPAVPLSIVFPEVLFYAVDANRRKQFAVRHFRRQLNLPNLHAWHGRAESFPHQVDYSVSRATATLDTLWAWHQNVARRSLVTTMNQWHPGLICRKGSDLGAETKKLRTRFKNVAVETIPGPSGQLVHVSLK